MQLAPDDRNGSMPKGLMGGPRSQSLKLERNCNLPDYIGMDTGFEWVFIVAIEIFSDIVGADKPWWFKLLASLGCLAATSAICAVFLLIIWGIAKAGGVIS